MQPLQSVQPLRRRGLCQPEMRGSAAANGGGEDEPVQPVCGVEGKPVQSLQSLRSLEKPLQSMQGGRKPLQSVQPV